MKPAKAPHKTTAEEFRHHVPGHLLAMGTGPAWTDVFIEIYRRDRAEDSVLVPAVAEPMVVAVRSGKAAIEEREFGGTWKECLVHAGDFFLTTSPTPYEMRWRVLSEEPFETCHVYLGLPLFALGVQEVLGAAAEPVTLREMSGERDPAVSAFVDLLSQELLTERNPSPLYVRGVAQSLAIYLVRHYPDPNGSGRQKRGELPKGKLTRLIELLEARLDQEFRLSSLAREAGMSEFHLSRVFKKTTGLSPSQYFIRLRMNRARQLLRETTRSMLEVALEVGYSSPSHFAQIFRREIGITPSQYRGEK